MDDRLQVAVLMGGPSAEREVSLRSGAAVAAALERTGAAVARVDVRGTVLKLPADVDVVFVALHGTFGEDGTVQRLLEELGLPYTFSDAAASARAFDKIAAKEAFVAAGISTPRWAVVERTDRQFVPLRSLRWPLVIKPARQGSSVGIELVEKPEDLQHACLVAGQYDDRLLVEERIAGREFTVAVMDERTLPVIEVRSKRTFFDYEAKYTKGETDYLVPAPVAEATRERMQALARQAHECLGCRDLSRVDMMMDGAGELFVLEVNTVPGFTETSLVPKAALADGMSFDRLCGHLVRRALARRSREGSRRAPALVTA